MPENKSVFISYSSADCDEVQVIIDRMSKEKIEYWKAPEMIPAGSNYAREIPKAIRECQVFLLVISFTSQRSIWVEKELDCALNLRKTIVPIQISRCELSDTFRFYLNNVQIISYYEGAGRALDKMCQRLQTMFILKTPVDSEDHRSRMAELEKKQKMNALLPNPQPLFCKYCEGELQQISRGVYQCKRCGEKNYDYFQTVRNYLEKEGPKPVAVISRATGIPRRNIDNFLREEMLEISVGSAMMLRCEACGTPIRAGYLCENCKAKGLGKKERGL